MLLYPEMGRKDENTHLQPVPQGKSHPGRPPSPALSDLDQMVAQIAQKTPAREVARRFQIDLSTLYRYMRRPEAQAMLEGFRAIIKQVMLERTMGGVVHGAFDVVEHTITEKDAKGLDAATRAVMNLEKVSASAAGEGRKLEITGRDGGPIQVDARALIADIVAHGTPDRA